MTSTESGAVEPPMFEHDERELELATLDRLAEGGWSTTDASAQRYPAGLPGRAYSGEA